MEKRASKRNQADNNSVRYIWVLRTDFMVEKVFQRIYTDKKFNLVQRECEDVLYCNGREQMHLSVNVIKHVIEDRVRPVVKGVRKDPAQIGISAPKRRLYNVMFNTLTFDVHCDCKMFETSGILCRHIIRVYDLNDVADVPEKYILRRWRKGLRRRHTMVKVAYHDPSKTIEVKRYDKMMVSFEQIAAKAMEYEDAMSLVMDQIGTLDIRLNEICVHNNDRSSVGDKSGGNINGGTQESVLKVYKDPKKKPARRGRPPTKSLQYPFQPSGSWKKSGMDKPNTKPKYGQKLKEKDELPKNGENIGLANNSLDLVIGDLQETGYFSVIDDSSIQPLDDDIEDTGNNKVPKFGKLAVQRNIR